MERIRLGTMIAVIGLFLVIVTVRLVQLQLLTGQRYGQIVDRQSTGKVAIPAARGIIYDRAGRVVARNVTKSSLYAHPRTRAELNEAASYLGRLFDIPATDARKRYSLKVDQFRWVDRHVTDALARRLEADQPSGLYLRKETARVYPFGRAGKQILGFTNIDSEGLSGFELSHDSILAGKKGWADIRRDAHRNTYRVAERALVKPVPGRSLVLTVDWSLQEIVEQELQGAVDEYNAESGMAAFVDCNTGDILAMAHFDPNEKNPDRPTKLCAISDHFEPGSAFKAFTASTLLEAGLVNFEDTIYCEMGRWKTGRRVLRDDKELGWLNFREIMELSSNIGLGKMVSQLEGPELIETVKRFGFGRKHDCGLPGEAKGSLARITTWSDYNKAAIAMGHSIAVTTLQMSLAMATLANGGRCVEPTLVHGFVDDDGNVLENPRCSSTEQIVRKSTSDSLKSFLRGVVEHGTGDQVNSEYVTIAGKTGTAEIPNLQTGGYYKNRFNASFCGFFPAEKPLVAGLVVLKNPRPITYGGHTSGKAFRRIAERYTICNPDLFARTDRVFTENSRSQDQSQAVPDLVGRTVAEARDKAERMGLLVRADDSGFVVWQFPGPDRIMLPGDEIILAVRKSSGDHLRMINLKGLSIRKAGAFLQFAGLKPSVRGNGHVRVQSIKEGSPIESGNLCRLICQPG